MTNLLLARKLRKSLEGEGDMRQKEPQLKYEVWCNITKDYDGYSLDPPAPGARLMKEYTNGGHVTNYLRGRMRDENEWYDIDRFWVYCADGCTGNHRINAMDWLSGDRFTKKCLGE